jgi:hypothetical protein
LVAQGKVSALAVGTGAAVFGVLCWQAVALKKAQIAAIPMQLFTQRQEFEKQLRLCLANIEDDALDFVLNLIKNFVP